MNEMLLSRAASSEATALPDRWLFHAPVRQRHPGRKLRHRFYEENAMQFLEQRRDDTQSHLTPCPDCGRTDSSITDRRRFRDLWDDERRDRFLSSQVVQCKCGCAFTRDLWV